MRGIEQRGDPLQVFALEGVDRLLDSIVLLEHVACAPVQRFGQAVELLEARIAQAVEPELDASLLAFTPTLAVAGLGIGERVLLARWDRRERPIA